MQKTTKRTQLLGFFISLGGFLFGYDIGVISGCLIMPDFMRRFGTCDASGTCTLTADRQSIITSLLSAGTIVGSLAQAPLSDFTGRRTSMIIWSAIFTLGALIQTASVTSIVQLTIGRFVAGLGVGALSGLVPLYLSETAPKQVRGAMVALYQIMIIFGIFLSYSIDWASQTRTDSGSWRIPVGIQMLWGLMLIFSSSFITESPRYKLKNNDEDGAREVMAKMRGCDIHDPLLEEDLREMIEGIEEENKGGGATYLDCFSKKQQLWKRTLNGCMLQLIQQLNGQNFYYYYGPEFFKASGVNLNAFEIQWVLGLVSVICTIPALISVDKVGRRRSLLIGSFGEAICALIVAFVGKYALAPSGQTPTPSQKSAGDAFIAFAIIHIAFYSTFWGPVPWVYLGESFPLRVRAKGISLGSTTNWIWNFLLSFFSPRIAAKIGPFIMLVFAGCLIFGFIYGYLMVPEVKGLSLEQVDELYASHVPPWRSASWVPSHGAKDRHTGIIGLSKERVEVRREDVEAATTDAPSHGNEKD